MAFEFGFVTLTYSALKDLAKLIFGTKGKDIAAIVEHRSKMKRMFEAQMGPEGEFRQERDVIIRDARRLDSYPDINDKSKRISPWFKVGFLGLYHRGILVGLSYEGIKWDDVHQAWRYQNYPEEEADLTAAVVGKIPFDDIIEVDLEGDEYYRIPHFFCRFSQFKKQPYEAVVFSEIHEGTHKRFYSDICESSAIRKLSKKLKVGHYRKTKKTIANKN